MRRRGIRNQLILNSLLLIFLPLISFTTYIFWHVYRVNPTDFMQLLLILSGAFVFYHDSGHSAEYQFVEKVHCPD